MKPVTTYAYLCFLCWYCNWPRWDVAQQHVVSQRRGPCAPSCHCGCPFTPVPAAQQPHGLLQYLNHVTQAISVLVAAVILRCNTQCTGRQTVVLHCRFMIFLWESYSGNAVFVVQIIGWFITTVTGRETTRTEHYR